jgi:hypothetical protein
MLIVVLDLARGILWKLSSGASNAPRSKFTVGRDSVEP